MQFPLRVFVAQQQNTESQDQHLVWSVCWTFLQCQIKDFSILLEWEGFLLTGDFISSVVLFHFSHTNFPRLDR